MLHGKRRRVDRRVQTTLRDLGFPETARQRVEERQECLSRRSSTLTHENLVRGRTNAGDSNADFCYPMAMRHCHKLLNLPLNLSYVLLPHNSSIRKNGEMQICENKRDQICGLPRGLEDLLAILQVGDDLFRKRQEDVGEVRHNDHLRLI